MTAPANNSINLIITGLSTSWSMNVVAFSSPVYGQINTAQVKTEAIHFPIKLSQPDLQLDVQFRNEIEFQRFQMFVRGHQKQISSNPQALLTLTWPQRYMNNFSGFITKFQAGGMRANYAPRARFVVSLVDSFANARTEMASLASNWQAIYGGIGMPNGVLAPPTAAELQQNAINFGVNVVGQPQQSGVVAGSR